MFDDQILRSIFGRLRSIERGIDGGTFYGKVKAVDLDERKARIVIGKSNDGTEVLGPWVPYAQTGGDLKIHNPPSIGQLMSMSSEGGDVEQGLLTSMQWTDENGDNHDAGDEHKLTFGEVTVMLTGGGITLTAGGVNFVFDGSGFVQTGGKQEHDGKNTGSDHVHPGIIRGGGKTDGPE